MTSTKLSLQQFAINTQALAHICIFTLIKSKVCLFFFLFFFGLKTKKAPSKGRRETRAPPVDLTNAPRSEADHSASPRAPANPRVHQSSGETPRPLVYYSSNQHAWPRGLFPTAEVQGSGEEGNLFAPLTASYFQPPEYLEGLWGCSAPPASAEGVKQTTECSGTSVQSRSPRRCPEVLKAG